METTIQIVFSLSLVCVFLAWIVASFVADWEREKVKYSPNWVKVYKASGLLAIILVIIVSILATSR